MIDLGKYTVVCDMTTTNLVAYDIFSYKRLGDKLCMVQTLQGLSLALGVSLPNVPDHIIVRGKEVDITFVIAYISDYEAKYYPSYSSYKTHPSCGNTCIEILL